MNKEKIISRQRKWQLKKAKEGKCTKCGKDISSANKEYCERHRQWNIRYQRRRKIKTLKNG